MKLGVPQIICMVSLFLRLGISLLEHGKPKEGNENFVVALFSTVTTAGLLWWGGFFG